MEKEKEDDGIAVEPNTLSDQQLGELGRELQLFGQKRVQQFKADRWYPGALLGYRPIASN